jgi:hypothetical protein
MWRLRSQGAAAAVLERDLYLLGMRHPLRFGLYRTRPVLLGEDAPNWAGSALGLIRGRAGYFFAYVGKRRLTNR